MARAAAQTARSIGDTVRAAAKADMVEIALAHQADGTQLSATRTVSIAALPTLAAATAVGRALVVWTHQILF